MAPSYVGGQPKVVVIKDKGVLQYVLGMAVPIAVALSGFIMATGMYHEPLRLVGAIMVCTWAMNSGKYIIEKLTRGSRPVRNYGKWAIVTGATSGVGEAFARELAIRGMSLLVVSRTLEKVDAIKRGIASIAPTVRVESMSFDFSKGGWDADAFYVELEKVAQGLDQDGGIGLLINNIGTGTETPEYFHSMPEKATLDMVRVNVEGTIRLTRTILPFLIKRQRGGIINVSSASGNHPTPLMSTYAATKAFATHFTRSLYHEVKEFGVDVLVITPYYVGPSFTRRVVLDALSVLGRYDVAYPYLLHAWQGFLFGIYWATPQALMKAFKEKMRASAFYRGSRPVSSGNLASPTGAIGGANPAG